MAKVYLFGYYGFGNLGDELLARYFLSRSAGLFRRPGRLLTGTRGRIRNSVRNGSPGGICPGSQNCWNRGISWSAVAAVSFRIPPASGVSFIIWPCCKRPTGGKPG